ncbi:MAG TPA: lipopolysaccharide biosynthesis protein RfbH [Candidatus Thermoplasmatota archaeon]|nr:lipopolysaccharide biosynthesis protein RfbH [Candidatus Thermoplasmatota archaeon]
MAEQGPRRALVVGASGLVGGALVAVLEREGFQVAAASRSRAGEKGVTMDVRDAASVDAAFAKARPDVVFLAVNASGGVDACEKDPREAHAVNVDGTRHVAQAAKRAGARLVYYSTDYVFDGKGGPYGEDAPPNPVSVYGRTKAEAERIVRDADPDRHLVLRTTAVFGWDRGSKNFAMQVWEKLSAGQPMRVPHDQLTNPTLAEFLAEVSVRLVQQGETGTLNVVGRDRVSRADLGRELAKTMLLPASLIEGVPTSATAQAASRPLQGGLSTEKLQKVLGTEAMALGEALKRFRRNWRADTHALPVRAAASEEGDRLKREILEKVREYHDVVHAKRPFTPGKTRIQYAGRVYGQEELVNLVDSSLDFWLTMGPWGDVFETRMKRMFGARDFALVNSGSTANLCAIMALQSKLLKDHLRPGDEVVTPAVTFPTTLAPIVHGGMTPVFVDCEIGTYNVDPALVEAAITPKTKAIVIPHTLGNPCDMDAMVRLAEEHDLWLMEDTCDALGGTWRGKQVGTFGDLATISFFPAHHITMGEGGGVVVNNPRLTRIVKSVRDWGRDCWCATGESNSCGMRFGWQLGELPHGYDHKFIYTNIGYNFKPTDMQAAVGVAQLDRLDSFIEARKRNFKRLYEGLRPYSDKLILPRLDPRSDPSWFGLPITVQGGVNRTELVQWLEAGNVETRQIFGGNILRQPAYLDIPRRVHGTLENSDRIMRDTFFIGVYPGLTEEMIAHVLDRFGQFFRR